MNKLEEMRQQKAQEQVRKSGLDKSTAQAMKGATVEKSSERNLGTNTPAPGKVQGATPTKKPDSGPKPGDSFMKKNQGMETKKDAAKKEAKRTRDATTQKAQATVKDSAAKKAPSGQQAKKPSLKQRVGAAKERIVEKGQAAAKASKAMGKKAVQKMKRRQQSEGKPKGRGR